MSFSVHHVRVFSYRGQGGNPLAIFLHLEDESLGGVDSDSFVSAARSVSWESVFITPSRAQHQFHLRFFMPNGNEVSMCAHAAIGAAWFLGKKKLALRESQIMLLTADGTLSATSGDSGARITVHAKFDESRSLNPEERATCVKACGLHVTDLCDDSSLPCLTSSIARPKTILPIRSADCLHSAMPMISEKDMASGHVTAWLQLCDSLGSTGLYLYHLLASDECREDVVGERRNKGLMIEARQFPRSSGYPEDPATGIAAATLAASLRHRGLLSLVGDEVTVYQGRAMGRCSEIRVSFPATEGCNAEEVEEVIEIWGEVSDTP